MQDLIVTLQNNVLRLSTSGKEGFSCVSADLSKEIVEDTHVLDTTDYAQILANLIKQITSVAKSKLALTFVVEPEDMDARFITVNKRDGEVGYQILSEVKSKLTDVNLDDCYFSYEKIAPFLYQFVAIKKDILHKYIDIANQLGISLKGVLPWTLLLPKYVKINDPAIFISKRLNQQVISLSELNGTFFVGVYDDERSPEDLKEIVKELSFYKRATPISKIFTFKYDFPILEKGFNVFKVDLPQVDNVVDDSFDMNILAGYFIDNGLDSLGQLNLLSLIPVPVEVKKTSNALVYVGAMLAGLTLTSGLLGGVYYMKFAKPKNIPVTNGGAVLSDARQSSESTSSTSEPQTPQNGNTGGSQTQTLLKKDLKIRIENGAGVSGLAARTREYVTSKGYVVSEIDTSTTTTKPTILKFKKNTVSIKDTVIADFKPKMADITVEETLEDSSKFDLVVIVGSSSAL